jgi:hypothetical protein
MNKALLAYVVMAGTGGALWWWVVILRSHIHGLPLFALIAGETLAMVAARPLEKRLKKSTGKEKGKP